MLTNIVIIIIIIIIIMIMMIITIIIFIHIITQLDSTPNLPANIVPATIRWLKLSSKLPMDSLWTW